MDALKILIIEDDLLLGAGLEEQLLDVGYIITDNVSNSEDALNAFRKRLPDIVICDIHLEESELDGIELAEAFNKLAKVPLIFLTAFGDAKTLQRAKKVNPANYLTKPCNQSQLLVALDLALENFTENKEPTISHIVDIQSSSSSVLHSSEHFFFVKKDHKYVRVEIVDIVWVEALGHNVVIYTDEFRVVLSANLTNFSKKVNHQSLIRIHRSYIININKLTAFNPGIAYLKYQGGIKEIPIGKKYKDDFQGRLPRLMAD